MINPILERLKSQLIYCPETGEFTWLISYNGKVKSGDIAGSIHHSGYKYIKFLNKNYSVHRLAWLYMTGDWPEFIDHIDGNKLNNSWINLRSCTHSQNHYNCKKKSNNTSGFKGVMYRKNRNRWVAICKANGKRVYLGSFKTPEEASLVYQDFAKINHGEFYYGN